MTDGTPPRRFFAPGSGGRVQRGIRQLQRRGAGDAVYRDGPGGMLAVHGEETALIKTSSAGVWNAFWDTGTTELRVYQTKKKVPSITLPTGLVLLTMLTLPRDAESGLLVYYSADQSSAYYVRNKKVTDIRVFDPADTDKETPLFPSTGVTIGTVSLDSAVYFSGTELFLQANFVEGAVTTTWVINLSTQTLITTIPFPSTGTVNRRPFVFTNEDEAWSAFTNSTPVVFNTSGVVQLLDTSGLGFLSTPSWANVGLVDGLPAFVVFGVQTDLLWRAYVINTAGASLVFTGTTAGGFAEVIDSMLGAAFTDDDGDYYELAFMTFSPDAGLGYGFRRFLTYSSRTGLTQQAEVQSVSADEATVMTGGTILSKDARLQAGYVLAGHYYVVYRFAYDAASPLVPGQLDIIVVSIPYGFQVRKSYTPAQTTISSFAPSFDNYRVVLVATNSDAGFVLRDFDATQPDNSQALYFISATRENFLERLAVTQAISFGGFTLVAVAEKNEISVFYQWAASVSFDVYRRIYKLLAGSVIDLGVVTGQAAPPVSIPFIKGLFTKTAGYCYVATEEDAITGGMVLADPDSTTFSVLSIIDTSGAITLVEADVMLLTPSVQATSLQPAAFTKQLRIWG